MRRRPAAIAVLAAVLVAVPVAAMAAAGSAAAVWRELVGDGRARTAAPLHKIVVLNAPSAAQAGVAGADAAREARAAQRAALSSLEARGIVLGVRERYVNALNAVSASVAASDVPALERAPEVRGVYTVRNVFPAGAVVDGALSALGEAARPKLARVGQTGTGVTVALLDGPVDAAHPYLRGRVLPGWNALTGAPAADEPSPAAASHGTAMAGIVAGADGPDGLRGVAPRASVLPIQVLGLQRGALVGTTETLLAGLDRALDPNGDGDLRDRADVVLAPLAQPFAAFAESPEAMAATHAEQAGTLLVGAAGNDGATASRFGTIATPAAGRLWLAVGASDGRPALPEVGAQVQAGDASEELRAVPLAGALAPVADVPLAVAHVAGPTRLDPSRSPGTAAGGDLVDDYVASDGARLVEGKAALVARDGRPIGQKAVAAAAAGARALVLYGHGDVAAGALGLDDRVPIPVLVLPAAAGERLAAAADAGQPASLTFGRATAQVNLAEQSVASFSSRGLGFHDLVKPDVVAPGVAITTSQPGGGYAAVSGTSAAAAQAAGVAALILDAHPGRTPANLRSSLVGTGRPLRAGAGGVEPVEAQGGGEVDPPAAVGADLVSEPATVSFGVATREPNVARQMLTLRNLSRQPLAVSLGFQRDGAGDGASEARLAADHPTLTIAPRSERRVRLTLTAKALPRQASVLGGWIVVSRADGAALLRVPWALATSSDEAASLVRAVALKPRRVPAASGPADPAADPAARLTIAVGAVAAGEGKAARLAIAPVSHLAVDLYRGTGRVTRLLDARSLLPGTYRYAFNARDRAGHALPPGDYRLVVTAVSVDDVATEREYPFTIVAPK